MFEQREGWRKQLESGEFTEDMKAAIAHYQSMRNNPTWRSTKFLELLGEIASHYARTAQCANVEK